MSDCETKPQTRGQIIARNVDHMVDYDNQIEVIAIAIDKAIAEEREACAKLAEATTRREWNVPIEQTIANAIRERGKSA